MHFKIIVFLKSPWLTAQGYKSVEHFWPPPIQNHPQCLEVCRSSEEKHKFQRPLPAEPPNAATAAAIPQPLPSTQCTVSPSQGHRAAVISHQSPAIQSFAYLASSSTHRFVELIDFIVCHRAKLTFPYQHGLNTCFISTHRALARNIAMPQKGQKYLSYQLACFCYPSDFKIT